MSTFVDDIKIMGAKNSEVIGRVKKDLTAAFEIVNIGSISFYLGLKISRDCKSKTLKFSQPTYIVKILSKFYLTQANGANMLIKKSLLIFNKREAMLAKQKYFQRMTSSIIFLIVETRPNIAFVTSVVSQFAKNPLHQYTEAVKTILQYLKTTRDTGIPYEGEQRGDLII